MYKFSELAMSDTLEAADQAAKQYTQARRETMNTHVLLASLKIMQRDAEIIQSRSANTLDIHLAGARINGMLESLVAVLSGQ